MKNLIGSQLGKYQIESLIGEGGMAAVYRAHDSNLDRDVAVKVILPGVQRDAHFLRRFKDEARSLAKLSHPNIVKIHDFGEQGEVLYLVLEYLPEGTLKERLGAPIPAAEAAGVLAPIARALAFAHRSGLVHRDIKPSNILFTESGDPMLTDFGIARLLGGEDTSEEMVGTPDYMAPEQGLGQKASPASDMYSLGEVFYEMITGRRPFEAKTPLGVLFKKADEPLPDPRQFAPNLPDAVVDLLSEVLAKTPEERLASMDVFAADLQLIQAGVEASAPPTRTEVPPTPGPKTGPVYGPDICPKCGKKLPQKAAFCPFCSTEIRKTAAKPEKPEEDSIIALEKELFADSPGLWDRLKEFAQKAWVWLNVGRRRWYALGGLVVVIVGLAAAILLGISLLVGGSLFAGSGKHVDGRRVIFSSYGDTFAIMENGVLNVYADSGQTGVFHQEVKGLRDAAFLPDDRLAVLSSDGVITLIDLEDKASKGEIKTGIRNAENLLTLADDRLAVVDVNGKEITIWRGDGAGKASTTVVELTGEPAGWSLSGDALWLATATQQGVLQVWDIKEKAPIFSGKMAEMQGLHLAFDPLGENLAVSSGEGLRMFRLPGGEMTWGQVVCMESPLVFSADSSRLACADGESAIVFAAIDGEKLQAAALRYPVTAMMFNQEAGTLFAVYEMGSVEYLPLSSDDLGPTPVFVEEEPEPEAEPEAQPTEEDALTELLAPTSSPSATATARPTASPTPEPVAAIEPVDLKVNLADGVEIVFVPAGEFTMGSESAIDPYFWGAEAPQHEVMVDDFWIYRTEVTNKQYADCVDAKACPLPHQFYLWEVDEYYGNPKYDDYPVLYVNWTDAQSYCRYVGGRLPYEAEWEKAARGTDGRMFPWGNDLPGNNVANLCDRNCPESDKDSGINDGYRLTSPVGSFPAGVSPYGAYDMAGNVWEWVFDYFSESYYGKSPYDNPIGPGSSKWRVVRGGAYIKTIGGVRTAVRYAVKPDVNLNTVGFRCVIENPDD